MVKTRWHGVLMALAMAGSPAALASNTDLTELENAIVTALDEAGAGYTNVRVLDEETLDEQTCYRIAFTDQGSDVELLLNAENFQPCVDPAIATEIRVPSYVPIYNPGVWAGIYSTLINTPRYPRDYNYPRRHYHPRRHYYYYPRCGGRGWRC